MLHSALTAWRGDRIRFDAASSLDSPVPCNQVEMSICGKHDAEYIRTNGSGFNMSGPWLDITQAGPRVVPIIGDRGTKQS
jgi:hypothetical protein